MERRGAGSLIDAADLAAHRKHLEWIMREFGAATMDEIEDVQPHKRPAFIAELKAASMTLGACFRCE